MPFFPLENTWTRAKEKGVQPEFVAKITPSCPTYPTSFFPEASARAPAHAHTHIHLCNPAPSVNSPSDVSRVLPMRGLCGWAPAAPCRKRAVSSCGWSHAGTNKPSTARRERERERELLSPALNSKIKRRGSRRLRRGGGMHACTDL